MDTVDWKQLDEGNKAHYQRRPRWVVEAESKQKDAEADHLSEVEAYAALTYCDDQDKVNAQWQRVEHAARLELAYYEYAQDCRASWHAGLSAPEKDFVEYLVKHGLNDVIEAVTQGKGFTAQDVIDNPGLMPDGFPI